jgi:hypothetical protein
VARWADMTSFKEQCISLRKKDHSLLEIAKITGRPKTSVYFHIRDLPLSERRRKAINEQYAKNLAQIALSRKGKSVRPFKTFVDWDAPMVFLTAHMLFDGEMNARRGCSYSNRSRALLARVEEAMQRLYAYPPARYTNATTGVHRISFYNVALSIYLKKKAGELLEIISSLPIELKREFVKAFFDDEGCMDFRPLERRRQIRGYQKNPEILALLVRLLADFDIHSKVQKPNEVVISGAENLHKFRQEIGFSPGVYINGNRTNSRWKKHFEKRELLEKAIASFKKK